MSTVPGSESGKWNFWIDRGGTFTDIIAQTPEGKLKVHKLLSQHKSYPDAPIHGVRTLLGLSAKALGHTPMSAIVDTVKMGTTVATNALLERRGVKTVLALTKGFKDALKIGYQERKHIFALDLRREQRLEERVIEVEERMGADGTVVKPLEDQNAEWISKLEQAKRDGFEACAIVFMHGYKYPHHERQAARIASEIGFEQVSISSDVSPLIKFVSRGDTTVVDAYLNPILRSYIDTFIQELRKQEQPATAATINCHSTSRARRTAVMFMQSNGGLTSADLFRGKDSILSGPAGGIVGAVETAREAGFDKIIAFDMGGTSTDVSHYAGNFERSFETDIAGVRVRAPRMAVHTVAAGGGSLLIFDGERGRVGPESAGAIPGPACYRNGGPLTVTDCNVMLGRLHPEFFPAIFGPDQNLSLDAGVVRARFSELADRINQTARSGHKSPEEIAFGFLTIAIDNMANAIKQISTQRGFDIDGYTLCCFGGAGAQHACLLADQLGMKRIMVHPFAGVLSALGMGLADIRAMNQQAVEHVLSDKLLRDLSPSIRELTERGKAALSSQGVAEDQAIETIISLQCKLLGADAALLISFGPTQAHIAEEFHNLHRKRYGFSMPETSIYVDALLVECVGKSKRPIMPKVSVRDGGQVEPIEVVKVFMADEWRTVPVFERGSLCAGDVITGPSMIVEPTGTNIVEPLWSVEVTSDGNLIYSKQQKGAMVPITPVHTSYEELLHSGPDPLKLEIFNNLFQFIAEQMGFTLQNTGLSVNIRERLDFSCALFDAHGHLVANAPHIPVHLGSMGEAVEELVREKGGRFAAGSVFVGNDPFRGGTHLPDITVITPVFEEYFEGEGKPLFFVASRGHHADVGGLTPGSMPPHSKTIHDEGILIHHFQLVENGVFRADALKQLLSSSRYPARNPRQNIADLQAQIAANERGVAEIRTMIKRYGLSMVMAYMEHVQANAEMSVRKAIEQLATEGRLGSQPRSFEYEMDNGAKVRCSVSLDKENGVVDIDFTGTSSQVESNFNAPRAITVASVLYVFRTLVSSDIPLNHGCLAPLNIQIPTASILSPAPPSAVVAGNVETSQTVTDTLYAALNCLAASQGTMNNLTFGATGSPTSCSLQYYETICGGSGAGPSFHGTDAIQTHMTNSRMTDPEVLESRYPVRLVSFGIRQGSGGRGKYRGGNGATRQIEFLEPMTAAILSNNRRIAPFGLEGGAAGSPGRNYILRRRETVETEELGPTATADMEPGDVLVIETPGGGGFGREGE